MPGVGAGELAAKSSLAVVCGEAFGGSLGRDGGPAPAGTVPRGYDAGWRALGIIGLFELDGHRRRPEHPTRRPAQVCCVGEPGAVRRGTQ